MPAATTAVALTAEVTTERDVCNTTRGACERIGILLLTGHKTRAIFVVVH